MGRSTLGNHWKKKNHFFFVFFCRDTRSQTNRWKKRRPIKTNIIIRASSTYGTESLSTLDPSMQQNKETIDNKIHWTNIMNYNYSEWFYNNWANVYIINRTLQSAKHHSMDQPHFGSTHPLIIIIIVFSYESFLLFFFFANWLRLQNVVSLHGVYDC